jgi:hypothetical protein
MVAHQPMPADQGVEFLNLVRPLMYVVPPLAVLHALGEHVADVLKGPRTPTCFSLDVLVDE